MSHADRPFPGGVWIGCSGWFYWHWKGGFYPEELGTHRWFRHYQSKFRTVELNAPFYRFPTPDIVKTWCRQCTRRGFRYSVKVNRIITHEKRLVGTRKLVKQFYDTTEPLGKRMGCYLFQFPPSFKFTRGRLKQLVAQLDPSKRNVVEFRHKTWWNEEVYDAFRQAGIIFCSISGPRLPDDLVRTTDELYVRFHGTKKWYRHNYTKGELAPWAERIAESGAKTVWIYFNNDRECNAIRNARLMTRLLKNAPKSRTLAAGR
jgi:uncharacterized protein YecE (DUF72 family)